MYVGFGLVRERSRKCIQCLVVSENETDGQEKKKQELGKENRNNSFSYYCLHRRLPNLKRAGARASRHG